MTYVPKAELPEFARNVRAVLKLLPPRSGAVVVYLKGNLGAGKTSFAQELAKNFGITEPVLSPTYTLMRSYDIPQERTEFGQPRRFKKLIHIDAYRLEKPEEFKALRPDEFMRQEGAVVLIEWPEKAAGFAPKPDLVLEFSADEMGEHARSIEMQTAGHG